MAILKVEGLVKKFGGLIAVNDLSFSVDRGKVLGIVGPNGSGKTTSFNLISGFIKPDSGKISLNGDDITKLRPYVIVRKGMARTFQIVRVFRHLSVYENVKAAKIFNVDRGEDIDEKIAEVIHLVGLKGKENEKAINLPIGDLKRLDIGRALAAKPSVLLLDEPFSGLSHQEVTEIIPLLLDLTTKGMAVVIVEHVLRELKRLAENIIVLNFGVKIAEGQFENVINQRAVREAYIGAVNNV